jgi:hypothetical protein
MNRLSLAMTVALMATACGGNRPSLSPTAPSLLPSPRPPFTVSGVISEVTAAGLAPLGGVRVQMGGGSGTTDGNGYYSVSGLSFTRSTVLVTKGGYQFEPNMNDVWIDGGDRQLDFQAVRLATLGTFSLTASPSLVTSGGQLTMSWIAPSGQGCNGGGDWIAIFRVGDPDITGAANGHSDLWYIHLCGATSGTSTLNAPSQPGQYEFRYMVGDTSVARSNPVTVNAASVVSATR